MIDNKNCSLDILFILPPIIYNSALSISGAEVVPNSFTVPTGALSAASYLEKKGKSTAVIAMDSFLVDWGIRENEETLIKWENQYIGNLYRTLDRIVRRFDPSFIGLSLQYTIQEPITLKIIEYLKTRYPEKPVILGGNHATFSAKALLQQTQADAVVLREGEKALYSLLIELEGNGATACSVPGLAIKNEKRDILFTQENGSLTPSEIPVIDWNLLYIPEPYSVPDFEFYVMASRGCPHHCTFCTSPSMWDSKVRFRNPDHIKREINELIQKGVRVIGIGDDTFLPDFFKNGSRTWLQKFEKTGTVFFCETRADVINRTSTDLLRQLHKAGLRVIYLGVEAGTEELLKSMKKNISPEQIHEACKRLKKLGIRVSSFWIFGHPATTESKDRKALDFIEDLLKKGLVDEILPHIYKPLPGTPDAKDPRVQLIENDFSMWSHTGKNILACHNIINTENGKIVYSAEQIKRIFDESYALKEKYNA